MNSAVSGVLALENSGGSGLEVTAALTSRGELISGLLLAVEAVADSVLNAVVDACKR